MIETYLGYSQAIRELARENNKEVEYLKYMEELLNLLSDNNDIKSFFIKSNFNFKIKKDVITKSFSKTMEKNFLNFLYVLIDHNAFKLIEKIAKDYIKYYNREHNILDGVIYSTTMLNEKNFQKIKNVFEKKLKKKIYLINKLDKNLIAGIKVEIDEKIYDSSYSKNLELLTNDIIKEMKYEQ